MGICLSGGGIRSAAYNLGVLQVLEERKVLRRATFVSAVSGGAYIASGYAVARKAAEDADKQRVAEGSGDRQQQILTPDNPSQAAPSDPIQIQEDSSSPARHPVFGRGSPEEEYFRNNSSYIAPDFVHKVQALSVWFRGFLLNLLIIAFVLLAAGSLLGWLFRAIHPCLDVDSARCTTEAGLGRITNHRWVVGLGLVPWLIGLGVFATDALLDLTSGRNPLARQLAGVSMTFGTVLGSVFALPYVLLLARSIAGDTSGFLGVLGIGAADPASIPIETPADFVWLAQLLVAGNVVAAGVRFLLAQKRSIYVLIVAAVAGPVLFLIPFIGIVNNAASAGPRIDLPFMSLGSSAELWLAVAGAATLLVLLDIRFNCNRTTLHEFYATRLSTVFAIQRKEAYAERIPWTNPLLLSQWQPSGPRFLYCAAANTLAEGKVPPGRNAAPFIFADDECGGKLTKRVGTDRLEAWSRQLSVPAAVAISGAAFSPTMGKFTKRLYTFLMTLVNARLGVWVPNPRFLCPPDPEDDFDQEPRSKLTFWMNRWKAWKPRPGLRYLVYEFLGLHRLTRRYIYVTDGGHYDNLGLVELLRRGCTEIWCFDASGDKVDTFNTLGEAISMARTDLLVEIRIEPEKLVPKKDGDGTAPTDSVVGTFRYPRDESGHAVPGTLIFTKAAVTAKAPWDVRAFWKKDKNFPNHSTIDQLFTDQKFESYRRLGEQAAKDAVEGFQKRKGAVPILGENEGISVPSETSGRQSGAFRPTASLSPGRAWTWLLRCLRQKTRSRLSPPSRKNPCSEKWTKGDVT